MQQREWLLLKKAPAGFFAEFPEYPPVVLQLLYDRRLTTQDQIDEFFNPDYGSDLHDPYLFNEMAKAVERIISAIQKKEKIIIYGDYDADGICGSVVLYETLGALGADIDVYIPDRFVDGYGLNQKALTEIVRQKVGLIITVDCGVTDAREVEFVKQHGIDVIIADHHLVPSEAPNAYAIIDPKNEGENYPFKYLCAAGVAFKLARALLTTDFAKSVSIKEGFEKWLLDLVTIASVADIVPLLGENRTLVKYGLIVVEKTRRNGLRMLLEMPSGRMGNRARKTTADKITSETIAFMVAPRINATSRMAHATTSFELLVTRDEDMAERLAHKVDDLNNERRAMVDQIMKQIDSELKDMRDRDELPQVIFIGKEDWSPGVVGLVSGRVTEKYGRPSFIYGGSADHFKGSCRGIEGFHVVQAMRYCEKKHPELLMEFGGHPKAGGFAVLPQNIGKFEKCLAEFAETRLKDYQLKPALNIDAEVSASDINWDFFDWLLRFEPFGEGNKKPVFILRNAEIASLKAVGKKEDHLKMKLKAIVSGNDGVHPVREKSLQATEVTSKGAAFSNGVKFFDCIGFGLSDKIKYYTAGDKMDIVFELEANEWNGTRELQLKLKDIRKSQ